MDRTNYADSGYTPTQVGRVLGRTSDRRTDPRDVTVENVRSGNARVGAQADEWHGDLNIGF